LFKYNNYFINFLNKTETSKTNKKKEKRNKMDSKKIYLYDYNSILINNETEVDFLDSVDLLNIFKKTNLIFTIIIIIIGLIGHFLTIFIFGQKRFRKNSIHVYILCLAINNTIYLLIHFSDYLIKNNVNLINTNNLICKLFSYLKYVLRFISTYIIISFNLQRLLYVCLPFQNRFKSKYSGWLTVCTIIIISCLLNSWSILLFEIKFNHVSNYYYCDVKTNWINEYFQITLIYLIIQMIIPIIIILICNSIIIYNLKKSEYETYKIEQMSILKQTKNIQLPCNIIPAKFKNLKKTEYFNVGQLINKITNKSNSTKKVNEILVFISFTYVLFNLPYLITWCIFYYGNYYMNNTNPIEINHIYSVLKISEIFYLVSYCINFYIYY